MNTPPTPASQHARQAAIARWAKKKGVNLQPAPEQPASPAPPATPSPDNLDTIVDALLPAEPTEPDNPEPPVAHDNPRRIGRYIVSDTCANNILHNLWAYVSPYRPT
jgi:hypothetical protein